MNLAIDIGNTYFKLAVFRNNNPLEFHHEKNKNFESFILKTFKTFPKIKRTIPIRNKSIDEIILNKNWLLSSITFENKGL